jgi:hypothetical protein
MRRLSVLVIFACLLTIGGCGAKGTSTPAGEFDARHGGKTVTPQGLIVSGSARDGGNGRVVYETEDGTKHEVQQHPDGSYSMPKEIK